MNSIPLAAMEKIMRKAGAERVSNESKEELRDFLEEFSLKLSKKAIDFCNHAGRKTIKREDIKLAVQNFS